MPSSINQSDMGTTPSSTRSDQTTGVQSVPVLDEGTDPEIIIGRIFCATNSVVAVGMLFFAATTNTANERLAWLAASFGWALGAAAASAVGRLRAQRNAALSKALGTEER